MAKELAHHVHPDPIIFRGLKSLTLDDSQQRSLLRLAQEGISVYSPHTAVDSTPGGMGDWLCDIVSGDPPQSASSSSESQPVKCQTELYSRPTYPTPPESPPSQSSTVPHIRTTILPSPPPVPDGFESAGMGRLVTFNVPQPLPSLVDRIARNVGLPGGVPIAIPQGTCVDDMRIRTVGVCPGSGSTVLIKGTGDNLPDLLLTGELSHHEALAVTERGSVVIALSHSNTERGYLHAVMRRKLEDTLREVWEEESVQGLKALEESAKQGGAGVKEGCEDALRDTECVVDVSQEDRDPFGVMIRL